MEVCLDEHFHQNGVVSLKAYAANEDEVMQSGAKRDVWTHREPEHNRGLAFCEPKVTSSQGRLNWTEVLRVSHNYRAAVDNPIAHHCHSVCGDILWRHHRRRCVRYSGS